MKPRTALLLAGVLAVTSGGLLPAPTTAAQQPAASRIRLYVFDGGTLESDPSRYQLTQTEVGVTQLAIAAYLIVHPKGTLMWDAGAVMDSEWTPTGSPVAHRLALAAGQERQVTLTRPIGAQLQAAGVRAADVTHIALSHHHWDHTANANAFSGATWLVRREERDAMFAEKVGATVRTATFDALKDSRTVIITADEHDVFGDGTVVIKAAPGHTPGHQVLYVKLAETGGVVLSGDLYHYPQERTLDRYPTFEFDLAKTKASRVALDAFLARTKARLWIQHDFTAHGALRKVPQYYE